MQQRGTELVLPGLRVLLDEAHRLQRSEEPVHGAFGKRELSGEINHSEPSGAARQQPEDRGRPLDGLNVPGHAPVVIPSWSGLPLVLSEPPAAPFSHAWRR